MKEYIKSRPWLYRSLRTFFQTFLSTVAGQFMIMTETDFNSKLIFSSIVSALAAGLSAVMNISETGKEAENGG